MIRCQTGGCGHWNVPALSHDLLDMIGPWHRDISEKCPGRRLRQVPQAARPADRAVGPPFPERRWTFAGYHVPQIIMPMHYADHEKWDTLVGKMQGRSNTTPTTFLNEVCGESSDAGSKLVTETDLRNAAVLPWNPRAAEAGSTSTSTSAAFLSVDWGGGGGTVKGSAGQEGRRPEARADELHTLAVLGMTPTARST
jgi:hypothetical protein